MGRFLLLLLIISLVLTTVLSSDPSIDSIVTRTPSVSSRDTLLGSERSTSIGTWSYTSRYVSLSIYPHRP